MGLYACVRKVICGSILTQVVLSGVPFVEKILLKKTTIITSDPNNGDTCYRKTWQLEM